MIVTMPLFNLAHGMDFIYGDNVHEFFHTKEIYVNMFDFW